MNSFVTQNLTYLIFTLGAYTMADIPKFLPFELRQVALYLWCSFTMIFNFFVFFIDDTNYQEEERKERKKEEKKKKKEEERKKKEEEKKQAQEKKMNPVMKTLIDVTLYTLYIAILLFLLHYGYNYYLDLQVSVRTFSVCVCVLHPVVHSVTTLTVIL